MTRTKRQTRIIVMTNEVGFNWDMRKDMCLAREHRVLNVNVYLRCKIDVSLLAKGNIILSLS